MMEQERGAPERGARSFEDELLERIAALEERLRQTESGEALRTRGRTLMDRVVPPQARRHLKNGGREGLLGLRTLIDSWVGSLDEDKAAEERPPGREDITIE